MSFSEVFLIGSTIGDRYEIVKRIGKGSSGRVYLALDKKMANAPRAIKQLAVDFVDYEQYAKAIEDFEREVKVLAALDHPSIPRIYDYFTVAGYHFLVMKHVEGKTLEQMLKEFPANQAPERTVAKWGIQLCDTLAYIHDLTPPIIYRDLKPANVMYDYSIDRAVLIDFGIARYVQSSMQLVTAIGTVGYAPPELYQSRVMPASDIYSLGATMYHLLTGFAPSNNPMRGFDFSSNPPARHFNGEITVPMENILLKAVEADPANRFASAREMKTVLEKHLAVLEASVLPDLPDLDIAYLEMIEPEDESVKQTDVFEPVKETSVFETLKYPPKAWHAPEPVFESTNAWLIIYFETKKVAEIHISKPYLLIGRVGKEQGFIPDLDLSIFGGSGKISRKHAAVAWERGYFYFEDLGSSNGSSFNGQKIEPNQKVLLQNGDYVGIGETEIEFLLG